jgi:hypothetical protein
LRNGRGRWGKKWKEGWLRSEIRSIVRVPILWDWRNSYKNRKENFKKKMYLSKILWPKLSTLARGTKVRGSQKVIQYSWLGE